MFQVLVQVVSGSSGQLTPRGSGAWQDFAASLQEDEPDNIESSPKLSPRSPVDPIREFSGSPHQSRTVRRPGASGPNTSSPKHLRQATNGSHSGVSGGVDDSDKLKLAARTVSQFQKILLYRRSLTRSYNGDVP